MSRGSILFIALWSLCLLSIFALYLGYGVRQKIILINRLNSRDSLHFIAEAGAKQAIAELRKTDSTEYDCLNETWSNNPNIFQEVKTGYGKFSVYYDHLDYYSGQQQRIYGIVDEERKLNLNKADLNDIQRLIMITAGIDEIEAQGIAAAIVDWRDNDSKLTLPLGSAEDRYYRNLSYPYEAKDSEFQLICELLLVRGISQEMFDKLRDYVTVYSNGKININTAATRILLALGINEPLVDKIIYYRRGEDEIEATEDDNIFSLPSSITEELNEFSSLSPQELAVLSNLVAAGKISTSSENFMIRSIALLDKRQLELVCVAERSGKILYWKEG